MNAPEGWTWVRKDSLPDAKDRIELAHLSEQGELVRLFAGEPSVEGSCAIAYVENFGDSEHNVWRLAEATGPTYEKCIVCGAPIPLSPVPKRCWACLFEFKERMADPQKRV